MECLDTSSACPFLCLSVSVCVVSDDAVFILYISYVSS